MSGFFMQKADTTQQYSYFASNNAIFNRADDIISWTTDNSASSVIAVGISSGTISVTPIGASLVLNYNFSGFSILRDSTNSVSIDNITNIYSASSLNPNYTSNPALLLQHDSAFTLSGSFPSGSNKYRFCLLYTSDAADE